MIEQKSKNNITGETVEKVPKQILGWDAEKNDLTECATINDFIIMRGHETPENHPLTIQKGFSTVSEVPHTTGVKSSSLPMAGYLATLEPKFFKGLIVDLIVKW